MILGSYAFSSVTLFSSEAETIALGGSDQSTDSGTDQGVSTFSDSAVSGQSYAALGSANDINWGGGVSNSGDSFYDTSLVSFSDSETDSTTISEQGTYGGGSFSFSSVVFQEQDAQAETAVDTGMDSITSGETGSSLDSAVSTSVDAPYALSADTGAGSSTLGSTSSLSQGSADQYSDNEQMNYSSTVYEAGTFAGGDYSFSSVAFLVTSSTQVTDGGSDTVTLATGGSDASNSVGTTTSATGYDMSGNPVAPSVDSSQALDTGSSTDSASAAQAVADWFSGSDASVLRLSEQGSYANGSYSFSSVVYDASWTDSSASRDTLTSSDTVSEAGTHSDQSQSTDTSSYISSGSPVTVVAGSLGQISAADITSAFAGGTTTYGVDQSSQATLHEEGTFAGGIYAFSSVAYTQNATSSWRQAETSADGNADTVSASESSTDSQTGGSTYDNQASDTVSAGSSTTESWAITTTGYTDYSLSEVGIYGNTGYAFFTVILSEDGGELVSMTYEQQNGEADSGSKAASDLAGGSTSYDGSGTFTSAGSSVLSYTALASTGYTVNAVGSFMNGSYSLSSFAYTVNYRDTNDSTSAGGGLMTFSGVNQGQSYSGTGSWARQETGDESENASLTELGCYANGSFNLSDIVYGSSGARSTSSGDTVQSTWSGEYYGTATYTGSDASDSSFSEYVNGSYSMGSYSMSSYALGGSSEGSGSWENKSIDSGESLDVTFNLDVHSTLHQTGVMSANAFSNVSYSFSEITEQSTTQIVDGGAVGWGGTGDIEIAGAGMSGTETITNDLWGSWDTADGISTLTQSVALPGSALVLVRPDDTGLHATSPDQVPVASCGPSMTQIPAMQTSLNAARAGEVTADGTAAAGEADSRALAWVVAGGELEAEVMGGAGQGGAGRANGSETGVSDLVSRGEPTQLENMVYTGQPVQIQLMQGGTQTPGGDTNRGSGPSGIPTPGTRLPDGRVAMTEQEARNGYNQYLQEQTRDARFGSAAPTVTFRQWLRGRNVVIIGRNGRADPQYQTPAPPPGSELPSPRGMGPGGPGAGAGQVNRTGVGQPGLAEAFIPFWGSGRAAIDNFQNGEWGWGLLNSALVVADVFVVKSLFTGLARVLTRGAAGRFAQRMGNAGMRRAGLIQNTQRVRSYTGAAFRVPDGLDHAARIISEVKNYDPQRVLYLTNQMRDYIAYARLHGYRFDLWVNNGQRLSRPLQDAIRRGWINLRILPP